jgi:succinate dehydrogenase / fumarate reductase membrane anchor subunit
MSLGTNLRPPLSRVRGLGAAKEGVAHWWAQRVTAVALVPLGLWFVVSMLSLVGTGYEATLAWIGSPLAATLLVLLIIAACHHAQLGLQVVVEDYVHGKMAKVTSLVLLRLTVYTLGVAAALAVLKIAVAA